MRLKTFSIERLKAMPRPPEYMDELRAVAVKDDSDSMTFDLDDPGYRALKAKYRGWAQPAWDVSQPSRGLGDTIAKITHATGIARVVKAVVAEDCGCAERQGALNKWVPYTRSDRAV
jgi:hypothetical protein